MFRLTLRNGKSQTNLEIDIRADEQRDCGLMKGGFATPALLTGQMERIKRLINAATDG